MGPTPREWLGAGLLALALLALVVLLVATALPAGNGAGVVIRAILGA